jgi:hypothetical protein
LLTSKQTRWILFAIFIGALLRLFRALEPAPFADSYHHWLVAARLVDVGGVSQLFTQPDGAWPPLYSIFAALILSIFGTSSMAPLVWGSVLCFALTTWMIAKLAAPLPDEPDEYQSAPIVAAFLYALCPLDILISSTPAMEPLAVLLVVSHWYFLGFSHPSSSGKARTSPAPSEARPGDPSGSDSQMDPVVEPRGDGGGFPLATGYWLLATSACLALACLTRYEAWGVVAFSIFSWRRLGWKRAAVVFGPAIVVCAWWLIAASLGALEQKLSPEAARHVGEEYSLGALYGRFAVLSQTLFLATSPFLPMALVGLRGPSRFHWSVRFFAVFLVLALFGGVISGAIAGSHRYIALALPVLAVSAARFWSRPSMRGALLSAGMLLLVFWVALAGYLISKQYQANLGTFWFYLQPLPLLMLFLSALSVALCAKWLRSYGGLIAVFLSLALSIVYLPIFSANELGRFIKPFQYAGQMLHEEEAGVVLIDNPVVGYFSQRPPKDLWMSNRRKELEGKFSKELLDQIEAQSAKPSEVRDALRAAGVTHMITEEVPYLFTRKYLLESLTSDEMTAVYWTRAFILREVAVFRLK